MNWVKVFEADVLEESDFVKGITVNGRKLCAVKYLNEIYFTQAYCPHAGAGLSGGWCRNGNLVCPFHRYEYDLQTGRGAPGQGDYIEVFPTQVRNDGVYVGFKEKTGLWKRFFGLMCLG